LDGSGSFDPDGDALIYTWREGTLALAQTSDPVNSATASLSTGTHTITLTVDDGHGKTASDAVVKTVIRDAAYDRRDERDGSFTSCRLQANTS
jgi:hypothetical protein